MVGFTLARSDRFWRSALIDAARDVLRMTPLHRKFATMNGESSVALLHAALKLHHHPHWMPGGDEWRMSDVWPPAGAVHRALALRADGELGDDEGPAGLGRPRRLRRADPAPATGSADAPPGHARPAITLIWLATRAREAGQL